MTSRSARIGSRFTLGLKWLLYRIALQSDERYLAMKSRLVRLAARMGWYERDILGQLAHLVRPGATVVDVGANCGVYTSALLRAVGSSGHVHALEPNPAYGRLLETLGKRHAGFHFHAIAAGKHHDTLLLHIPRLSNGAPEPALGSFVERSQAGDDVAVAVTPLDSLFGSIERLDLVKIDVEGSELDVLIGSTALLHRFHPVLIVESLDLTALERLLMDSATGYRRIFPTVASTLNSGHARDFTYVFEWRDD